MNLSTKQVAQQLGVSINTVRRRAKLLGVGENLPIRGVCFTPAEVDAILAYQQQSASSIPTAICPLRCHRRRDCLVGGFRVCDLCYQLERSNWADVPSILAKLL